MPRLIATTLLLLLPGSLLAQPPITDVIPKEAMASVVLRSVDDFKVKGKQLLSDLDRPEADGINLLVTQALAVLQVGDGLDFKAPVVLSVLDLSPENIVLMLPIADREKILKGFKLDRSEERRVG